MAIPRRIRVLDRRLAIAKLPADAPWPAGVPAGFVVVTRTDHELSVVCDAVHAPEGANVEPGWRALEVHGPLDFSETGVLASLAGPLAAAKVSIFAISTFDTDYVLVRETDLERAIGTLESAGWAVDQA